MKQHEAVIEAMKQLGGYATLGQLYRIAPKIPNCKWETKTPFASIRRIVQERAEFFKIKPGLWALASERNHVLKELGIAENSKPHQVQDFTHYYYQGLAVEVGNLNGYQTCIPNQDKNKPFLQSKLADVATLPSCYDFTYKHLVRRAKSIDATWFNERNLPHAFFEIEHGGDIQNSLLKFVEFQDFRVKFHIVADAVRRSEFETKIGYNAFVTISKNVKFLSFDALSDWYTKLSELAALQLLTDL